MTQAILCSEAGPDGDSYFLVENEEAFKFFTRASNAHWENEDPGGASVEYWGGWTFDVANSELDDVLEDNENFSTKDEFIAYLIADDTKIVTAEDMKKLLVQVNVPEDILFYLVSDFC